MSWHPVAIVVTLSLILLTKYFATYIRRVLQAFDFSNRVVFKVHLAVNEKEHQEDARLNVQLQSLEHVQMLADMETRLNRTTDSQKSAAKGTIPV